MRWALLVAVLASLVPATAAACSCMPRSLIVQWELTDPRARIFIGTVEARLPGSQPEGSWGGFLQSRLMQLRPHLVLRGLLPTDTTEVWGEGPGDCGPELEVGQRYLVVARPSEDGRLSAQGCSSTMPLWALGSLFGFFALALLLAVAGAWALHRGVRWLLARLRLARSRVARAGRSRLGSPLPWLTLFVGLTALALFLLKLAPRLAPPLEVSLCNRTGTAALEQVEAQLMPASQGQPPTQLGALKPGECGTAQVPVRGEESVQFSYRLQGTQHVVRDPALGYVVPGFQAYAEVQGPGKAESGLEPSMEPDRRIQVLVWGLLASLVGATAALLCAAGVGCWTLVRRLSSARAG